MAPVLELRAIDKVYRGAVDTQVLFGINLAFEEGSMNSIVGESGSGKSTLMNIMGTLDRPTRGEVYIDGSRTDRLSKNRLAELRNQTVGFVFQFHYLLPEFTARENVLLPHMIRRGRPSKEVVQRVDELFELVGISRVKNNPSTKMSGGQQQRVAIIRALVNNPRVLLADEPTGNVDSANSALIYRTFRDINERFGTTFIVITHDRRIADQTDRVIELKDGRIEVDVTN